MDRALQYINQYLAEPEIHRDLRADNPLLAGVPDWWRQVILAPANNKLSLTLNAWEPYRSQLTSVIDFLIEHLRDVILLTDQSSALLLYELEQDGRIMYYVGGNPLVKAMSASVRTVWEKLPPSFRGFYDTLHNGWYYLATNSMGPSPTEDFFLLSELDWSILEEIGNPGCDLEDLLAVYTNGMGGYVAVSVSGSEYADVLWWKDKPPRLKIDAWAVIDSWTEIGLGRTDCS